MRIVPLMNPLRNGNRCCLRLSDLICYVCSPCNNFVSLIPPHGIVKLLQGLPIYLFITTCTGYQIISFITSGYQITVIVITGVGSRCKPIICSSYMFMYTKCKVLVKETIFILLCTSCHYTLYWE